MVERSGITFEWEPLPDVLASGFDTLGVNVTTFRKPLNRAVREVMSPSLQKNFAVGGRPPWQPLVQKTIQQKAKRGQGADPLYATGKLAKRAGAFDLWTVTDQQAAIQGLPGAISYGIFHQDGWQPATSGAGGDFTYVEPRPWAVIQEDDANEIEEIFFEWIEERVEQDIKAGKRSGF